MSQEIPCISVIIPHYNMNSFLTEAVDSVLRQSHQPVDLIIVDDGSNATIDRDSLPAGKGVDISYFEIDHAGKATAVNRGLREARGDYITILDADDMLSTNSLADRLAAIEQAEADLCIGSFVTMYDGEIMAHRTIGHLLGKKVPELVDRFLWEIKSSIHQNGMLFSRELAGRTDGMDDKLIRSQDKDFSIRLLQHCRKMTLVDEPVYVYRRYERAVGVRLRNRLLGMRYALQVIVRYTSGVKRLGYTIWAVFIQTAKLGYDFFGVYKK